MELDVIVALQLSIVSQVIPTKKNNNYQIFTVVKLRTLVEQERLQKNDHYKKTGDDSDG